MYTQYKDFDKLLQLKTDNSREKTGQGSENEYLVGMHWYDMSIPAHVNRKE